MRTLKQAHLPVLGPLQPPQLYLDFWDLYQILPQLYFFFFLLFFIFEIESYVAKASLELDAG